MTNSISPLFSSLHSVTLDDWITGLGEKALVAWLRFHSWNDGQVSPMEPFLLPLSLNKIIQRLKIGKATFYNKILQPLLDYGLIGLQPAPDTPRELHLLVYTIPEQAPNQKAESSPTTICSNDIHPIENPSSYSSSTDLQQEDQISPEPLPDPTTIRPCSEPIHLPHVQLDPPVSQKTSPAQNNGESDPSIPCKKIHPRLSHSIDSLPVELQQAIMEDPRLVERRDGISKPITNAENTPLSMTLSSLKKCNLVLPIPMINIVSVLIFAKPSLTNGTNLPHRLPRNPPHPPAKLSKRCAEMGISTARKRKDERSSSQRGAKSRSTSRDQSVTKGARRNINEAHRCLLSPLLLGQIYALSVPLPWLNT